jgi:hypothetical protein
MEFVTRRNVLETLVKHETLTVQDVGKFENIGFVANNAQLRYILSQLIISGYLAILTGVSPETYTITTKGIAESKRLEALKPT